MAEQNGDQGPRPTFRESELLPAMMAVVLAVAAQLALNDGLVLLAVAGYVVAAWLFVASVRALFDSPPVEAAASETAAPGSEAADYEAPRPAAETNRLEYLRHNWRLVTLSEIFRGDIPPVRLQELEPDAPPQPEPLDEAEPDAPFLADKDEVPIAGARLESWSATEAPESAPRAVKVMPQGDVLVLDTGLAQVQRFNSQGRLVATYELAELAGVEILDLAVSPDGRTLYVVDANSNRLQVITLSGDDLAEEEE